MRLTITYQSLMEDAITTTTAKSPYLLNGPKPYHFHFWPTWYRGSFTEHIGVVYCVGTMKGLMPRTYKEGT